MEQNANIFNSRAIFLRAAECSTRTRKKKQKKDTSNPILEIKFSNFRKFKALRIRLNSIIMKSFDPLKRLHFGLSLLVQSNNIQVERTILSPIIKFLFEWKFDFCSARESRNLENGKVRPKFDTFSLLVFPWIRIYCQLRHIHTFDGPGKKQNLKHLRP